MQHPILPRCRGRERGRHFRRRWLPAQSAAGGDGAQPDPALRTIYDTHGRTLHVERSAGGRELTVQPTFSSTRHLDSAGVRALLDVIASSPVLRHEMRKALAVYEAKV